jgi:hypothetical protein
VEGRYEYGHFSHYIETQLREEHERTRREREPERPRHRVEDGSTARHTSERPARRAPREETKYPRLRSHEKPRQAASTKAERVGAGKARTPIPYRDEDEEAPASKRVPEDDEEERLHVERGDDDDEDEADDVPELNEAGEPVLADDEEES